MLGYKFILIIDAKLIHKCYKKKKNLCNPICGR